MTDTSTTSRTRLDRPLSGRGRYRLLRSIGYDARLVVLGMQTMADAVTGQERTKIWRRDRARGVTPGMLFGYGLITSVLGVLSWFLIMLLLTAIVRGPFYGFVEDGPFGPGTWGGPTKAGAWAAHAGISLPIIVALLFGFHGISRLHAALVRRFSGHAGQWVLPATISVGAAGLLLIWSWLQQL